MYHAHPKQWQHQQWTAVATGAKTLAATSTTPGARATTATSMGEVDGEDGEREDDDDGGGSGDFEYGFVKKSKKSKK